MAIARHGCRTHRRAFGRAVVAIARPFGLRRVRAIVLGTIAASFVAAEIVHPTTYAIKRSMHIETLSATNDAPIESIGLDNLPPIVDQAMGNIDVRNVVFDGRVRQAVDEAKIPLEGTLVLEGWCADPVARTRGRTLFVIVDGQRRLVAHRAYGIARADVATHFAAPMLSQVGFTIAVTGRELGLGKHSLQVALVSADARGYYRFPTIIRTSVFE